MARVADRYGSTGPVRHPPAARPSRHGPVILVGYFRGGPSPANRTIPAKYRARTRPRPKAKPLMLPAVGKQGPKAPGQLSVPILVGAVLQQAIQRAKTAASAQPRKPAATGYVSPFARSGPVTGGRIDQGVDYTGQPGRPIGAIGPGRVTIATQGSGWPGGGFIAYVLSGGPARGRIVYTAEDVAPTVTVGQNVKAGQTIGRFNQGGWIESGWGAPGGDWTLANATRQSGGSVPVGAGAFSTGYGVAFDRLIRRLRGPGGRVASRVSGGAPAWASATGGPAPAIAPSPAPGPPPAAAPVVQAPSIRTVAYTVPVRPRIPSARPAARPGPPRRGPGPTGPFQPRPGPPTIFGVIPPPPPQITPVPTESTPTTATARRAESTLTSALTGGGAGPGKPGAGTAPPPGRWDWLLVLAVVGAIGFWAWKEWKK